MKARLKNGEVVELPKDCECRTHDGPHWIHMDDIDRERNRDLLRRAQEGSELASCGFAQEESVRLREKLREMENRQIQEIIR